MKGEKAAALHPQQRGRVVQRPGRRGVPGSVPKAGDADNFARLPDAGRIDGPIRAEPFHRHAPRQDDPETGGRVVLPKNERARSKLADNHRGAKPVGRYAGQQRDGFRIHRQSLRSRSVLESSWRSPPIIAGAAGLSYGSRSMRT